MLVLYQGHILLSCTQTHAGITLLLCDGVPTDVHCELTDFQNKPVEFQQSTTALLGLNYKVHHQTNIQHLILGL